MRRHLASLIIPALSLALCAAATDVMAQAQIVIVNVDGPNEGFNDPTAAAPVGGNVGTTVGQQRLIAFQYAADIWGSLLDSSVPIYVQASFDPLTCTPTAATLGAAGTIQIFANFPGRELNNTWYHVALANKLAGVDLAPGANGTVADDIQAFFNSNLNGNPACLGGRGWYYGLDYNHGTNIDLVTVLLHEFGHGLGFANFVTEATGSRPLGLGDIYSQYTLDTTTEKTWNQMTTAELVASAINFRRVAWNGIHTTSEVPDTLAAGTPVLRVNTPPSLAGLVPIGTAAFGPPLSSPGVTADVVQALDPADVAGPTTFDGCSPLTNAAAVAGRIALIDRGTCTFTVKAKNAQNAGAIGVIISNVTATQGSPAGMGGADSTIVIPSVQVSLADGTAIRAALPNVNATIGVDAAIRAGATPDGMALLYAPNPLQTGSSISHWDTSAFPNLLMEPAINADLTHDVDLTLPAFVDIGWFSDFDGVADGRDECLGSDQRATTVIDGCDSGVPNTVFTNGCRISDYVGQCAAGATNHGGFASCVADLGNQLRNGGVITGAQKGKIQSCAAQARLP